jgi:Ca2+-binding EF-hand superfamily protein
VSGARPAGRAPRPGAGRLACGLAACVLFGAGLVPVAGAHDSPQAFLAALDRNGDGRIDLAEFQDWMIRGFDRMDANGNGILDLDEQPPGARRLPVSRGEHLRALEAAFRRQDLDGDGVLDAREFAAPPR